MRTANSISFSLRLVTILALSVSSAVFASAPNEIRFANGFGEAEKALLQSDLVRLGELRLSNGNPFWERELKASVTSENLQNWLLGRVQFLLPNSHPFNSSVFRREAVRVQVPKEKRKSFTGTTYLDLMTNANQGSGVLMTHLSGPYYLDAKKARELRSINLSGIGWIAIDSPRVGIVKIGPALFEPMTAKTKNSPKNSQANSIYRLQTLLHEGRHSDGNHDNTTFPHQKCPQGHTYQGRNACDGMSNGAYRIGAEAIQLMLQDCADCSEAEKEALLVIQADNWERVLPSMNKSNVCDLAKEFGQGVDATLCDLQDGLIRYEKDTESESLIRLESIK